MSDEYLFQYHNTNFRGSLPTLETFQQVRGRGLEWLEDNYAALLPQDRNAAVLDIGCGMGEFLYFLKRRGFQRIEGVDISSHLIEYCRALVGCEASVISDLEDFLRARPNRYDLIYLGDVIEHFPKTTLLSTLEAICTSLKPGGCLLLRTNNAAGIQGTYSRYTSLTHEFCFNERVLRKVLETAGFAKTSIFGERLAFRWRPKFIAWLALRKIWYSILSTIYLIEIGSDRPRVLTRLLLARAWKG